MKLLGILIERAEVLHAGTDVIGPRELRRVHLAIRLRDRLGRIGGEVVPEVLEVDPLASLHQRQRRLTEEMKMPLIANQPDARPFADTGQIRVQQRDAANVARKLHGIRIRDHHPHVVTDQAHLVVAKSRHERVHVARHRRLRVTLVRCVRLPGTAQVSRDHRVTLGQLAHQRPPHVAGLAEAMQQQHRVALPHDEVMQPDAVRLCEFAFDRQLHLWRLLRQSGHRPHAGRNQQCNRCPDLALTHSQLHVPSHNARPSRSPGTM